MVVADFGEDARSEQGAEAGEAEQDLAVGVLAEGLIDGCREVVGGLAGGVQLLDEGQELMTEGVLDGWKLTSVFRAEDAPQALGFAVEGASTAAALESGSQLGEGQFRGSRRGGGQGEDDAGVGAGQAVFLVLEGMQGGGVVLPRPRCRRQRSRTARCRCRGRRADREAAIRAASRVARTVR
jgi:hypothetical protein